MTTHINPHKTPFAITIPISLPNNKSIVHSARKPANVVKDEPNIDLNVWTMASAMAFFLSLIFFLESSYLWYRNIEKSVVTPNCSTAEIDFVI